MERKAFDKIQHSFIIKTPQKTKIEENYIRVIKAKRKTQLTQ
jgi:hypothetical protein